MYDGRCYWSPDEEPQSNINADDSCLERGGKLVAFPSDKAIDFVGSAW